MLEREHVNGVGCPPGVGAGVFINGESRLPVGCRRYQAKAATGSWPGRGQAPMCSGSVQVRLAFSYRPIGLELGATDTQAELLFNVAPGRPAMPLHVIVGDRIGDALAAQSCHQPDEHNSGVAMSERRLDLVSPQVGSNVVNPCC